jgi:Cu2+-exporting ATPase
MNYSGAHTLKVTAAGGAALIDEIEKLLEKAASAKSRAMRLADRASRVYAPVVHLTAALTLAGWLIAGASVHDAVITAIAVLIITCRAHSRGVPPVGRRLGRAIPRECHSQRWRRYRAVGGVDTVVFDNSTDAAEPRVVNTAALDRVAANGVCCRAGIRSRLRCRMRPARVPFDDASKARTGRAARINGIDTRLGSPQFCDVITSNASQASAVCFRHGKRFAVIAIAQKLRPDAVDVVNALRGRGFDLCILSGDHAEAVAPVARALGIEHWQDGLKPAQKIACIETLKASGRRVLMVGDGLNDAPSLAAAHNVPVADFRRRRAELDDRRSWAKLSRCSTSFRPARAN